MNLPFHRYSIHVGGKKKPGAVGAAGGVELRGVRLMPLSKINHNLKRFGRVLDNGLKGFNSPVEGNDMRDKGF